MLASRNFAKAGKHYRRRAPLKMWPGRPRSLGEMQASPSRRLGLLKALASSSGERPYQPMVAALLLIGVMTAGVMGLAFAWEVGAI
ncbi:MAG: hypothetical protein ACRC7G_06745 [Beijerinckiaceae bacterium]